MRCPRSHVPLVVLLLSAGCVSPATSRTESPVAADAFVSPALRPPEGRFLKRRVAIARFSNETTYGKSPLLGVDVLGKQASDILASRLASTQKFVLYDTEGLDQGEIQADYKIVGSVSQFGRSTTGEAGIFSKTKTQKAFAAVNLRAVSARTGVVIFSAEGRGEAELTTGKTLGIGTAQGFDASLSEKAISAAISKVISDVVERMLDEPWSSSVLRVEDETCFIAGGASQGLAAGDRFHVLKRGEIVDNPQTGVPIELPGKRIAVLEVLETFGSDPLSEASRCRIVEGTLDGLELGDLVVKEGGES